MNDHDHPHDHDHDHGPEQTSTAAAEWTELLHSRGLRVTPARLAVLGALRARGHASPEEVHGTLGGAQNVAAITLSTVYRTLDSLAECGLVAHTHLAGHLASYSLASGARHAHLVCRVCGKVSELSEPATTALALATSTTHGFVIDVPHLSIFGLCRDCADRAAHPG